MTTIATPQISDYDSRMVQINVTGVCKQNIKRVSNYQIKVPHHRLNEAMREIYSLGGKITGVNVLGNKSEAKVAENPPTTKSKAPTKEASKTTTTSKRRTKRHKG